LEALRTGAGAAGLAKIEKLMNGAESEHVQLGAAQWLAGLEAVAPVPRSEVLHHHTGDLLPGLVIVQTSNRSSEPVTIDGTATVQPTRPRFPVNMKGTAVPHPSLVKNAENEK
jgi:hypothetical protein